MTYLSVMLAPEGEFCSNPLYLMAGGWTKCASSKRTLFTGHLSCAELSKYSFGSCRFISDFPYLSLGSGNTPR